MVPVVPVVVTTMVMVAFEKIFREICDSKVGEGKTSIGHLTLSYRVSPYLLPFVTTQHRKNNNGSGYLVLFR